MIQRLYFTVRRASTRLADGIEPRKRGKVGGAADLIECVRISVRFGGSRGGTNHRGGRWMSKREEWREKETDETEIK